MNTSLSVEQAHALADAIALHHDPDPQETSEWRNAFVAMVQAHGAQRARQMLDELVRLARQQRMAWRPDLATPYVNTISPEYQPSSPGDPAIEERLGSLMRWNALAMVVRANRAFSELGGHIASYASAADLFEIGFNHFFHAKTRTHGGDLVFFRPHSAPGAYGWVRARRHARCAARVLRSGCGEHRACGANGDEVELRVTRKRIS